MMATGCRAIVTIGLLAVTPSIIAAESQTRAATATTRYFVFYNDLATNLNDALMAAGLARRDRKAELRQQYLVRVHLAGHPLDPKDASARQFVELAAAFRNAAQPAYEACRWPA